MSRALIIIAVVLLLFVGTLAVVPMLPVPRLAVVDEAPLPPPPLPVVFVPGTP